MAREPKEWISLSRRSSGASTGGIWLYINSEILGRALKLAGIPANAKLKCKRYSTAHRKGIAVVMITIKEDKTG